MHTSAMRTTEGLPLMNVSTLAWSSAKRWANHAARDARAESGPGWPPVWGALGEGRTWSVLSMSNPGLRLFQSDMGASLLVPATRQATGTSWWKGGAGADARPA